MMLKIMPSGYDLAFKKQGNFDNYAYGLQMNPVASDTLAPFFYDQINPLSLTVSTFQIQKLSFSGDTETVGAVEALNTALIQWVRGTSLDTFWYPAEARISLTSLTGYYQYYIELSDASSFISEPFYFIGDCDEHVTVGDYDKTDYDLGEYYV